MENQEYSVGLDIGTTKIVAIVGRRNEHGKIEVMGVGKAKSLGVHKGIVNNISQTITSIKAAVEEAQKSAGVPIKNVTVGIAGKHIRSLQHSDYIMRENPEAYITEDDIEKLKDPVYAEKHKKKMIRCAEREYEKALQMGVEYSGTTGDVELHERNLAVLLHNIEVTKNAPPENIVWY